MNEANSLRQRRGAGTDRPALEQIATTNTEARIRTEVQLGELKDGQQEIKALIQAHDSASKKTVAKK